MPGAVKALSSNLTKTSLNGKYMFQIKLLAANYLSEYLLSA